MIIELIFVPLGRAFAGTKDTSLAFFLVFFVDYFFSTGTAAMVFLRSLFRHVC